MNTMTKEGLSHEEKSKIAENLHRYIDTRAGSANKASKLLTDVNIATVSKILSKNKTDAERLENWNSMSDQIWTRVSRQVAPKSAKEWIIVPDSNYEKIMEFVNAAGDHTMTFGIIGDPGWGKTTTSKDMTRENVCRVVCNEFFSKRDFLKEVMKGMGIKSSAYFTSQMVMEITKSALESPTPWVFYLDEMDKLRDDVLYLFITFFNMMEDRAGIVAAGTKYLQTRIETGAARDKKGYAEILRRLGGKFIELSKPSWDDLATIARANGMNDTDQLEATVGEIYSSYNSDKDRLKRKVLAWKRKEGLI